MKAKLKGILTLLLALVVQISFAQEKTISGTVSDASGVLPGVSVSIKGSTHGELGNKQFTQFLIPALELNVLTIPLYTFGGE